MQPQGRQPERSWRLASTARRIVVPVVSAGTLWSFSYVAYKYMQLGYQRHCTDNLLRAVLFSRSDACVHLAAGIQIVEQVSGKMLYALGAAVGYHLCKAATRLTNIVQDAAPAAPASPTQVLETEPNDSTHAVPGRM